MLSPAVIQLLAVATSAASTPMSLEALAVMSVETLDAMSVEAARQTPVSGDTAAQSVNIAVQSVNTAAQSVNTAAQAKIDVSMAPSSEAMSFMPEVIMCTTFEPETAPPEPPIEWCSTMDSLTNPRCAPVTPAGAPSRLSASAKPRSVVSTLDLRIDAPGAARCPYPQGRPIGPAERSTKPPVPPPRSA
ncbi:MAG: hypothetical protein AAFN74_08155 [Myxococcota bacterium]